MSKKIIRYLLLSLSIAHLNPCHAVDQTPGSDLSGIASPDSGYGPIQIYDPVYDLPLKTHHPLEALKEKHKQEAEQEEEKFLAQAESDFNSILSTLDEIKNQIESTLDETKNQIDREISRSNVLTSSDLKSKFHETIEELGNLYNNSRMRIHLNSKRDHSLPIPNNYDSFIKKMRNTIDTAYAIEEKFDWDIEQVKLEKLDQDAEQFEQLQSDFNSLVRILDDTKNQINDNIKASNIPSSDLTSKLNETLVELVNLYNDSPMRIYYDSVRSYSLPSNKYDSFIDEMRNTINKKAAIEGKLERDIEALKLKKQAAKQAAEVSQQQP